MAKRALVVGINDYRNWRSAGFGNLAFCRADATAFADLLRDAFLFPPENIVLCEDHEATRAGILNGIQRLLQQAELGDVVCFFFAGHGDRSQLPGSSTFFETIVPYDGAAMVSDIEINRIARSLELNRVNFTMVLDSCHSGGVFDPGATQGDRVAVWTKERLQRFVATCRAIVPFICTSRTEELLNNVSNLIVNQSPLAGMTIDSSKDFSQDAKATLISACNYDQTAKENASIGHGFLTSAFLEMVNRSNFVIDHTALHQELKRRVSDYVTRFKTSAQTPQLRGRPVRMQEDFLHEWTFSI